MKHFILLLASIILLLNVTVHADVVVFVHGLAGFGPDELLGLGYWGFPKAFFGQDYLKILRDRGHAVFYASVGPVSSNWDRACELYAQIKGTRVDYGQAHSSRFGHSRYGKDYTGKGFYPSWDGSRKIHLVGHSMGGNTIRMLEMLLQKGAPEEVSASGSGVSNLFKTSKQGGNTWIHSVFTIATPHDGSTLHTKMGGTLVKFIKDLAGVFAGVMGLVSSSPEWGYNLDLDHFGLVRKSGEGFWTYFDRVFASPIFQPNFKDLASWDLSPQFCREFNAKTQLTYPNTYYFSAATVQTHSCFGNQCPDIDIEPLMSVSAALIGKLDGVCDSGGFCFNNDWEPNDGLVPLRSSKSPRTGISGYVDPLSWNARASSFSKGRWYSKTYNRDHTQIIGFRINPLVFNAADGLYTAIADTIDRIRVPATSEFDEALQGGEVVEADAGMIAGSVIGAVLGVAILAVGVVTVRRMRHKKRMVTAFSSKPDRSSSTSFSPRKYSKKQVDRASITLSAHLQSENPAFVLREKSQSSSVAAASEIPTRLDA